MCNKCKPTGARRMDKCMHNLVVLLQSLDIKTLASCCGHGRYPMSLVVQTKKGKIFDLMSKKDIPRKKRFYRKDKDGYYYIPEVTAAIA